MIVAGGWHLQLLPAGSGLHLLRVELGMIPSTLQILKTQHDPLNTANLKSQHNTLNTAYL